MTSSPLHKALTLCAVVTLYIGIFLAEKHLGSYTVRILNLMAINAILAISLNLIYGFTGMFSLGHAGFMAIGAYVCTMLILTPEQKIDMWILEDIHPLIANLSLPFLGAVIIAGFAAAFCSIIIALPVLRLGGDYLGIATLGFAEIIRVVLTNATPFTNGALGIKGIPEYSNIWSTYTWLLVTIYVVMRLLSSNIGNVFKAIRDDEIAARTMGINTFYYRTLSFAIGAFFAGIGGALTASLISTIDPKMFSFLLTFNVLMIVVAGGLGSITGSIIGSVVITFMLEWLRIVEDSITIGSFEIAGIPGMRMVIFSIMLMCIILFRREGILGMREFSWDACIRFIQRPFTKISEEQK